MRKQTLKRYPEKNPVINSLQNPKCFTKTKTNFHDDTCVDEYFENDLTLESIILLPAEREQMNLPEFCKHELSTTINGGCFWK